MTDGEGQANASRAERGAGLVEYALLVALLTLVALGAVEVFGTSVVGLLDRSGSSLVQAGN